MSQSNVPQKSICGDSQCPGLSCKGCQAFRESEEIHMRIQCRNKSPSCCAGKPCDKCFNEQYPKHNQLQTRRGAVGGGSASDVVPSQEVHGSSNQEICYECNQPLGSNTQACGICASVAELPTNPAQPNIQYDDNFGPMINSFGPCTDDTTQRTLECFLMSFEASNKNRVPFTEIFGFNRNASLLRRLLSQGVILGIEGFNNSCYYVVVFWMLSQGNMHERINTDCLSGHILYKILWDLRAGLFVGRDIVEAFRLSLREYPLVQSSTIDFEKDMDDIGYLLGLLEDNEVGILKKGPMLSDTACSFHIHEITAVEHGTIQQALCASMKSPSPVLQDGSIISFQFCQQKTQKGDKFTKQTLGTDFEFPYNGVIVNGKLFRPKMFIIYIDGEKHYLMVLCIGELYFLANSLSASQCGHYLPEMREISEQDAMELFRTQAHTIVFECVGNFWPPPIQPYPSVSDTWFPPPPPAPCAQVAYALPPPPPQLQQACGAQSAQPLPPPPQTANAKVYRRVLNIDTNLMDMIYCKNSWSLNIKGRNGKNLATGEIIGTGKTCQYKFGDSFFSSRDELEIALQAKYGKESRLNFC